MTVTTNTTRPSCGTSARKLRAAGKAPIADGAVQRETKTQLLRCLLEGSKLNELVLVSALMCVCFIVGAEVGCSLAPLAVIGVFCR